MKIRLSSGRFKLLIWCPYCLLFNRLAALIISVFLRKMGVFISVENVHDVIKSFKKELKKNKKLTVLQVNTALGFELTVRL